MVRLAGRQAGEIPFERPSCAHFLADLTRDVPFHARLQLAQRSVDLRLVGLHRNLSIRATPMLMIGFCTGNSTATR